MKFLIKVFQNKIRNLLKKFFKKKEKKNQFDDIYPTF